MQINFLGDSITYGCGADSHEQSFPALVAKYFGATENNFGISGTRIARQSTPTANPDDEYFFKRAVQMPKNADFTIVMGGTNDFGHGDAPLGQIGDSDVYTFCGAFDELVRYLTENFPKDKICFVLPLARTDQENACGDGSKRAIAPLSAYINVEKQILNCYGVDCLDLSSIFPKPNLAGATEFTVDGLHPNNAGHKLVAEQLIGYLQTKI